jgi:hypothetical protein
MPRPTSVGRILKNDYGSLLMLIAIGVAWLLVLFAARFGFLANRRGDVTQTDPAQVRSLVIMAVVVTVVFGFFAPRRIARIRRVIADGPACDGTVTRINFVKDRGRVEYEYQFNGETYEAGNAIWKNRETEAIRPGQRVELIVDPSRPSRAFLASLYVKQG